MGARERTSDCLAEIRPLYAGAGTSSDRIASFVCDELAAEAARRFPDATPTSDPRALRLAGLLRLHPSDVGEILAVRRAIAAASPEACAALWLGGDGAAEARGLAPLTDDELRRFARTVVAITRSARSTREPLMTIEDAEERFGELLEDVLADGGPEVAAALAAEASDPERACEATRAILGALEALPPQDRAIAARAWLVIEMADVSSSDATR
jgi:hypothetical protein